MRRPAYDEARSPAARPHAPRAHLKLCDCALRVGVHRRRLAPRGVELRGRDLQLLLDRERQPLGRPSVHRVVEERVLLQG